MGNAMPRPCKEMSSSSYTYACMSIERAYKHKQCSSPNDSHG